MNHKERKEILEYAIVNVESIILEFEKKMMLKRYYIKGGKFMSKMIAYWRSEKERLRKELQILEQMEQEVCKDDKSNN